jgi:type IV pilus assembly protein PilQ
MKRFWNGGAAVLALGATITLLGAAAPTHSRPAPRLAAITGLKVASNAGRAEVSISVDGAVDVQDFTLRSPHRIVVDIDGATLRLPSHLYDGVVRAGIINIRAAQFRPTTVRIVLDVDGERAYSVEQSDGAVRIVLANAAPFSPWTAGAAQAAVVRSPLSDSAATSRPAVRPVVDQAERSAGSLPRPNTLNQNPPRVITPAQNLPRQSRRITISFRDTPLLDVLAVFADVSGHSIVPGDKVGNPRITAEIIDQPWEVALNAVLHSQGLAATSDPSGIIVVDSYANLAAQRASEPLERRVIALNYAQAKDLQPTVEKLLSRSCGGGSIQVIGSGGAGDVAAQTQGAPPAQGAGNPGAVPPPPGAAPVTQTQQQQYNPTTTTIVTPPPPSTQACPARGSVVEEVSSNSLVITEVASQIDQIVDYVQSFDFKVPQVNIRAKIIAIDATETQALGISYDIGSAQGAFNTLIQRQGTPAGSEFQVNLGGDAFAGVANASRTFKRNGSALSLIYNTALGNFSLTSFLDALQQHELSDIQAEPSVNTLDKQKAELFVGNKVAYLITPPTSPGAIQSQPAQISSLDVGIKLTVTPSISANRTVRLDVVAEQSTLLSLTQAGPTTQTRNTTVPVMVNDGETVVIAGLTQTETRRSRRGIPLLMDLPMIGRLFAENSSQEVKTDLLILITPHILDDPVPPRPPGGGGGM